jgi:4-aminobutyrate aminotransferase/(S)-3-amino-2-methylpropionate transaminase
MDSLSPSKVLELLGRHESRNITHVDRANGWPIVWERARGCSVWDIEGRRYTDLTAAFGVAAAGHANAKVVAAARNQAGRLLHAMGDVHPHAGKALLLAELSRRTFGSWRSGAEAKSILTGSGSEAVECALKTARLATGRAGVIAFEGAYHGLGYGALNATHREHFRARFRDQLGGFVDFVPFPAEQPAEFWIPDLEQSLTQASSRRSVGAVLVEPIQARGGIRVPPDGFLRRLRRWCDANGALLILDEIYTGFGRTGAWFACEHEDVVPDLICLGKAMTGGFPMGACVGISEIMDRAWPESDGEAIHTSTFLGHPVGCVMALAQIAEVESRALPARSKAEGEWLRVRLNEVAQSFPEGLVRAVGRGLMAGLEVRGSVERPAGLAVVRCMQRLLGDGFIVLPEGAGAEVLSLTPPLTISRRELGRAVGRIHYRLREVLS